MLKIWGLESSDKCRFCSTEIETVDHLFWYCHVVAAFWQKVQQMLFDMNIKCQLCLHIILLGFTGELNDRITINLIIHLGKRFIFNAKNVESLNMFSFLYFVVYQCRLEQCYDVTEKENNHHQKRWANIKQFISERERYRCLLG